MGLDFRLENLISSNKVFHSLNLTLLDYLEKRHIQILQEHIDCFFGSIFVFSDDLIKQSAKSVIKFFFNRLSIIAD
jgi:hypothetical protein